MIRVRAMGWEWADKCDRCGKDITQNRVWRYEPGRKERGLRPVCESGDCVKRPSGPVVPRSAYCPQCGSGLVDQKAKVLCGNPQCSLFQVVIENCCGD